MKIAELIQEAPKGSDWKIQYQVRSKDADSLDSGSFVVHDYADKARAKAAAVDYLLKKFKGREATVTRITQEPWKKVPVQEAKAEVDLDDLRSMYSDLAEQDVEFDENWTVTDSIKSFFGGALSEPEDFDLDAKRKRAIKAVLKSPGLMKKLAAMVQKDIDERNS